MIHIKYQGRNNGKNLWWAESAPPLVAIGLRYLKSHPCGYIPEYIPPSCKLKTQKLCTEFMLDFVKCHKC